jgi:hypothetical protein
LNFRKAFENRQEGLWLTFKIGEMVLAGFQNRRLASGQLSKSVSWLWPAFKSFRRSSEKSIIQ